MFLKSGDKSTCKYAIHTAEIGLNSKMSHLIRPKSLKKHQKCIILDVECTKNMENINYNAFCYQNRPKTPVTRITRSFAPGIM